jgi:hypothetical protein
MFVVFLLLAITWGRLNTSGFSVASLNILKPKKSRTTKGHLNYTQIKYYQVHSSKEKKMIVLHYLTIYLPTSFSFAWVTLLLLTNFVSFIDSLGYFVDPAYAGGALVAICIFSIVILIMKQEIAYSLVIIWGLGAIVYQQSLPVTRFTALVCIGVLGFTTLWMFVLPFYNRWAQKHGKDVKLIFQPQEETSPLLSP